MDAICMLSTECKPTLSCPMNAITFLPTVVLYICSVCLCLHHNQSFLLTCFARQAHRFVNSPYESQTSTGVITRESLFFQSQLTRYD
ncbi:hypothetical protein AHF37_04986 [Paragonimus kellicotti]|nr:hypothetical protein AHF37_04986 [Paragonimus kellicotti]